MSPEDVWAYPRPPRLERVSERLRIMLGGLTVADTHDGWRVLETSHPPTYYLPADCFTCTLVAAPGRSICEWKGAARMWTLRAGTAEAASAGWSYPSPTPSFVAIRDHLAVYAGRVDGCFVDDEQVVPQPGGFYGGWITANLTGPFKGVPGSMGW